MTEPLTPTVDPSAQPQPPTVDTSPMDNHSTAEVHPKNGTHLVKLATFEPSVGTESGAVEQWRLTLDAAETIPDDAGGTIPDGTRLGTFTVFMAPSQYRSLDECIDTVCKYLQAFNGIIRDPRNDRQFKAADAAFKALPVDKKRPGWTGSPPFLDHEIEYYTQWSQTVVLATLATRAGKDGILRTNLVGIAAANGPRATRK